MTYGAMKKAVVASLAFYFLMSFVPYYFFNYAEVYPFFSWSLFSWVPGEQKGYVIEITKMGGEELATPFNLIEQTSLFNALGQVPTEYRLVIQRLGSAIENHDEIKKQEQVGALDGLFPQGSYAYNVIAVTYDPVEHWKTGAYQSEHVVSAIHKP